MTRPKENGLAVVAASTERGPFGVSISEMTPLFDPKNLELLNSMGGPDGICQKLHVNPKIGLLSSTHAPSAAALQAMGGAMPLGAPSIQDREAIFGRNVLPPVPLKPLWKFMWLAMQDKTMILLTVAALVSLAFGLYLDFSPSHPPDEPRVHWIEGCAILVAVLIVMLASSLNDYQKERQFQKLNAKKDDREVKVFRNGEMQLISIHDVVVGDIMNLEPGDVIATDGVLIEFSNLKADESAATGESDTIKKNFIKDPFILSGSKITEGVGKYVVCAVGEHSFFGKTMMALRTEASMTPLQVKLDALAEKIAKFGAGAALLMFLVLFGKYLGIVLTGEGFGPDCVQSECAAEAVQRFINIVISSITVIVVAVPEGLPLAVTLALAYATTQMLKDNNLVRVLSSCEVMGGATTICSDKTGTLTQNRMTVVKGVVGRNVHFDGAAEIQNLYNRAISLPSTNNPSDVNPPRLMEILCQGIAINSSAFEGFDEHTKQPGFIGSKTETALLEWMVNMKTPLSYKDYREAPWAKVVQVYPFASERKCMATIIKIDPAMRPEEAFGHKKPFYRIFVKGASEIVLKFCDYVAYLPHSPSSVMPQDRTVSASDVKLVRVDAKENYNIQNEIINTYAQQSLRTICLAYRDMEEQEYEALIAGQMTQDFLEEKRLDRLEEMRREMVEEMAETDGQIDPNIVEQRLSQVVIPPVTDYTREDLLGSLSGLALLAQQHCTCLAIVGIEDPLRPGVSEAVAQCQKAGVVVRMVTGDNLVTAKAIASKCGIYQKGWGFAMEGPKFRTLSVQEMDRILPRLQVLARSSPTDKQILVGRLKALGETVAVTGDGTNDGPALKMADVGFSMGIAGTEVAKEASSIVLMDDNFASIVKAMIWGRAVNDAVKKFLQFQLTVNVTAVALAFISAVADGQEQSVLTAVQLLWVNLIMDTLAALGFATEKPTAAVLDRPPEGKSSPLITLNMWKMIASEAIFQITVSLILLFSGPYIFGFTEFAAVGGITANINNLTAPPGFPGSSLQYQELLTQQKMELRTIIFNTFVFMQMFNQFNCRRLDNKFNIFENLWNNKIFVYIFFGVIAVQIIIIFFGGYAFQTVPLDGVEWAVSIVVGFMAIPIGALARLIPNDVFFFWRRCLPKKGEVAPVVDPYGPPPLSVAGTALSVDAFPSPTGVSSPVLGATNYSQQMLSPPLGPTSLGSPPTAIAPTGSLSYGDLPRTSSPTPSFTSGGRPPSVIYLTPPASLSQGYSNNPAKDRWLYAVQQTSPNISVFRALRGGRLYGEEASNLRPENASVVSVSPRPRPSSVYSLSTSPVAPAQQRWGAIRLAVADGTLRRSAMANTVEQAQRANEALEMQNGETQSAPAGVGIVTNQGQGISPIDTTRPPTLPEIELPSTITVPSAPPPSGPSPNY